MKQYMLGMLCVIFCFVFTQNINALLIDFDTGYTAGERVAGQPDSGTPWTSDSSTDPVFVVTTNGGVNNSQAIQFDPSTTNLVNFYKSCKFEPSQSDVGDDFDIDGAQGILKTQFYFRNDEYTSSGSRKISIQMYRSGSYRSYRGEIQQKGTFAIFNSDGEGGNLYLGNVFTNATHFYKITFIQDYDNLTQSVYVDDEAILEDFPFNTPYLEDTDLGWFGFGTVASTVGCQFTIDDISIEGVPKPPEGTVIIVE